MYFQQSRDQRMLLFLFSCHFTTRSSIEIFIRGAHELRVEEGEIKKRAESESWLWEQARIGVHELEIHAQGCEPYTVPVELKQEASSETTIDRLELDVQCQKQDDGVSFSWFAPGIYTLGSSEGDEDLHDVELTKPLWVMQREVDQELYSRIMSFNPAERDQYECSRVGNKAPPTPDHPVYCISWFEALEFANAWSEKLGYKPCYVVLTQTAHINPQCNGFRLPTESEWEAFASVGLKQIDDLERFAWIKSNSQESTHSVGQKEPNGLGLYDVLGNVWEWTWDRYGDYPSTLTKDPQGASAGGLRVMRGGTWAKDETKARISDRANFHPVYRMDVTGVRLVQSVVQDEQ
ncbi:MAG: hypothetical protein CMK59_06390 [Proteobacteria bacterium]|nr:hypothetical protein [Pseudomonadota bacterium]